MDPIVHLGLEEDKYSTWPLLRALRSPSYRSIQTIRDPGVVLALRTSPLVGFACFGSVDPGFDCGVVMAIAHLW